MLLPGEKNHKLQSKVVVFFYIVHIKVIKKKKKTLLRLLRDSFEGLQYQVGLVDEPVGTGKHVYCPGRNVDKEGIQIRSEHILMSQVKLQMLCSNTLTPFPKRW